MKLNLLSCDTHRPDKRAIAKCIAEISSNISGSLSVELTEIILEGDPVEIEIEELPTLSDVKINGIKKGQTETIISDTELKAGKKLSESFMTNTQNYLENKYRKDGFLNTKVTLNTTHHYLNF